MELDRDSQASPARAAGWESSASGDAQSPIDQLAQFIGNLSEQDQRDLTAAGRDVGGALAEIDAARHGAMEARLAGRPDILAAVEKSRATAEDAGRPLRWRPPGSLYEVGDRLPNAVVMRAADVKPGDLYWGCQERNIRKGWMLLAEPAEATNGAVPTGGGSTGDLQIGSYVGHTPDTLVLIERRSAS